MQKSHVNFLGNQKQQIIPAFEQLMRFGYVVKVTEMHKSDKSM